MENLFYSKLCESNYFIGAYVCNVNNNEVTQHNKNYSKHTTNKGNSEVGNDLNPKQKHLAQRKTGIVA